MNERFITLSGGASGAYRVRELRAISGASLEQVAFLDVHASGGERAAGATDPRWQLHGVASNLRYASAGERAQYAALQAPL
ncbi:MAG TPA: chlorite dismutase, partial [Vicinamibacteria bacterium]